MQKDFQSAVNKSSSTQVSATGNSVSEAEQALKSWGIEYAKQPDGSILVPGDLDISGRGLTKLPNLSSVKVVGNFSCSNNQLTSLEGAPHTVGGCFYSYSNQLTSLKHAPHNVGGNFYCCLNQLTSLEHAPHSVSGEFDCSSNHLTSLDNAPHTVSGGFFCSGNQLSSLECAPQKFEKLHSDFGEFASWDAVPEQLRLSADTKQRREKESQIAFSEGATVLNAPIKVSSPLRLKLRAP